MRNDAKIYAGESIVSGIGCGKAVVIHSAEEAVRAAKIKPNMVAAEFNRFEKAKEKAGKYYDNYSKTVIMSMHKDFDIPIIEMYKHIVEDPMLTKQVLHNISIEHYNAESAVRFVAKKMIEMFRAMDDEYFKDRDKDVEEVRDKILQCLSDEDKETKRFDEDVVLVIKRSLVLSDIIGSDVDKIKAVVCASSGKTSHAVIIARSNSIPVIGGVDFEKLEIKDGDTVLVDSDTGTFTVNPTKNMLEAYHSHIREMELKKHGLPAHLKRPVFTKDGVRISVMANVSLGSDAKLALNNGADGIGLVRTEILFTENSEFPSEKEQIDYYIEIFENIGRNNTVYIRVMDIGGDKIAKFLTVQEEKNPFMGWRAVRIYREKNELLEVQLRAIIKAGYERKYGIMFPMITTSSEWDELREITQKTASDLNMQCPELGVLFEVPLAILEITTFLDTVNFASIGTNDLIQYLSAADRTNSKVNYLYNPIEPAFLKIVKNAIDECNFKGKPVSMCGDMAARPECTILLLGLGLTRFSVAPPMIPIIKEIASSVSIAEVKEETVHMISNLRNTETVAQWIDYMNGKYCKSIFEKYGFVSRTREL